MGRKCSHCRNIGHNSRTCTNTTPTSKNNNGGTNFMLFGVPLDISNPSIPIKKTLSFESSSSSASSSSSSSSSSPILSPSVINPHTSKAPLSYLNDSRDLERNKGVAWSEEEHRMFLIGLEKLGKGDWRGISKNFVMSRTPTQVASHAQKYFLRQACGISKVSRRRSSLFDAVGSCRSDCHGLLSISADSKDGLDLYQNSSSAEDHCSQHSAYSDKTLIWTTYDQPSCTENKMDDAQPELELGLSSPLAARLG